MQNCSKPELNGCREWNRRCDANGYGRLNRGDVSRWAHREAWRIHRGNIPEGLFVLHKCDNRKCVNPDHLFLGSARDNALDMVAKGRHWRALQDVQRRINRGEIPSLLTRERPNG
jgi:hypothetical protein